MAASSPPPKVPAKFLVRSCDYEESWGEKQTILHGEAVDGPIRVGQMFRFVRHPGYATYPVDLQVEKIHTGIIKSITVAQPGVAVRLITFGPDAWEIGNGALLWT